MGLDGLKQPMNLSTFISQVIRLLSGGFLQQFTTDDQTLDLAGALVDLVDLGIAHQLLNRVLAVEAGSTEYLDGIGSAVAGKKEVSVSLLFINQRECRERESTDHLLAMSPA